MKRRMPVVCLALRSEKPMEFRAIAIALLLCAGTSLTAQQSSVTADVHPVASPASPNVDVKVGSATSTSAFRVFNSTPGELLSVRGDGLVVLGGAAGSAWDPALLPAFESRDTGIAFGMDTDLHLASNAYPSAGIGWRYKTSDLAANSYLYKGGFGWRVAPAGTAGSVLTWVNAMNLNNAGNLNIGPIAPVHRLDVSGSPLINGDSREVVGIYDTSPMAAGVGGGIVFGGNFQTTGPIAQQFASIEGIKENGANGDYAGALAFNTRLNQGYPAERMRISSAGKVGINTTTFLPQAQLDVWGEMRVRGAAPGTEAIGKLTLMNSTTAAGDVYGPSPTATVAQWVHVVGSASGMYGITPNGYSLIEHPVAGPVAYGRLRLLIQPATITNVGTMVIDGVGNLTVGGNISATGTIFAKYQDVAEWVPAKSDMLPGTVVILNPDVNNEVMASSDRYDVRVAGVVSGQPGLLLGEAGESKEQIATTGRVRVRVDATAAPIRIGDLLVTSDKPGKAMRSVPLDLGGVPIHRPGTIIGKALEPLAGGQGEILVLLSLQ